MKRPDGHQFTRAEVAAMSVAEFDVNEAEIVAQHGAIGRADTERRRASRVAARTAQTLPAPGEAA